jgi:hypothetical protein
MIMCNVRNIKYGKIYATLTPYKTIIITVTYNKLGFFGNVIVDKKANPLYTHMHAW